MIKTDEQWLLEALNLADSRKGQTCPNPSVGAILVSGDRLVSSGCHFAAGCSHAEVEALSAVPSALGMTLYVTLEPCCHYGQTPPCTDMILNKQVSRVVFSLLDPNPEVAGQGQRILLEHGVECVYLPIKQVDNFYREYRFWRRYQRPWLSAKIAMTANRMIAFEDGRRMRITGPAFNHFTHQSRLRHDAILTTLKTVVSDDPQFNVRLNDTVIAKTVFVLDRGLEMPVAARVLQTSKQLVLLHACDEVSRAQAYERVGIQCVYVGCVNGSLDLYQALKVVAQSGYHSLWLEAGGRVLQAFLRLALIQSLGVVVSRQVVTEGLPLSFKAVPMPTLQRHDIVSYGQDTLFTFDF